MKSFSKDCYTTQLITSLGKKTTTCKVCCRCNFSSMKRPQHVRTQNGIERCQLCGWRSVFRQECLVASNHLVKFWEQSAPVTGQEEDGASTADSRGQCLLGVTYRLQKIPPRGTTNLFNKLYWGHILSQAQCLALRAQRSKTVPA